MSDIDDILEHSDSAVAIVGMACHLPGSLNISEYWSNLRNGVESVKFFTDEELLAAGESPLNLVNPNYVRAQPALENFNRFDANFWGFSPQDAAVTDPSHRIFLEVASAALEHAGHTGYDSEGRVGVFASAGENLYRMRNLNSNPQLINEMGEFLVRHTGNCMNFMATRLSYELDLRGPSLNVQTACSSGLVSVHLAAQHLLNGECDIAIAGGSTLVVPQGRGYIYTEGEIHSPDGHCRPFDVNSNGTVFGSGAGAIILRRIDDALDDGDTIYAIVRGSAINNDGAQKIGFLAPGVEGQVGVLAEALEISGVDAEQVSYIEAHGTGTKVGDPIEFEALNQVYRDATDKRSYCRVGSVKSNIGHLGESAGAASIIKVVLALQNKEIPPTLNYTAANSEIDLDNSPFLVADKLEPWVSDEPRFAGITALGAGGTNAHLILQEAPTQNTEASSSHNKQLLVLSAKTPTALNAAGKNLALTLASQTDLALADVAYTLQVGRRAYPYRRAMAVTNSKEAISLLEKADAKRVVDEKAENNTPSLVFMYPGGGAQYAGMGAELYAHETVYREAFDDCLRCLNEAQAAKIKQLVFAKDTEVEQASKALESPSLSLPSLFATEYALTQQLLAWGAKPNAFIGHSMGEYTAACLAGVFSLEDAMSLVLLRGQLFEKLPLGGMLSVGLAEQDVRQYMFGQLDIAAVNATDLCVVSGLVGEIKQLQKVLEDKSIDCTRIRIDVAAHSSMLDEILDEFRIFCQSIKFSAPQIPFTSNLTGGWITDSEATDPNYWVQHLRSTVKFSNNVATVLKDEPCVLVEIGPGRALTNLSQAGENKAQATFNSMRHFSESGSDIEFALRTYGHMWAAGVAIEWDALWGDENRRRVALPTYPFERKTYWVEPGSLEANSNPQKNSLDKLANIDDWFGRLSWAQSTWPPLSKESSENWLIFEDDSGLADEVVKLLGNTKKIVHVKQAAEFVCLDDTHYQLNPNRIEDMQELFHTLAKRGIGVQQLLYLWALTGEGANRASSDDRLEHFDSDLNKYFFSLFNLAKAAVEFDKTIRLSVITADMQSIGGLGSPEKALVLGPVNVLAHEMPNITSQSIDISWPASEVHNGQGIIAKQIVREVTTDFQDRIVAFRSADRWVQKVISTPLLANENPQPWLRNLANVLITGGLGGIGLTVAKQMADKGAAHLILLTRKKFPAKVNWLQWLEEHAEQDATSQRILAIQAIEKTAAKVLVRSVDVIDGEAMHKIITELKHECGAIHGVIHAAGTIDDQLIYEKTALSAKAVLESKLKGALILDSNFANDELDFFVVFSSIASFLGLPGQIDYTAANAFLDTFAQQRSMRSSGQTLAINWNAWRDIGMVVNAQMDVGNLTSSAEKHKSRHPVFEYYIDTQSDARHFSSDLSAQNDWLIAEHRINNGAALIPGTGLIELFRGAFVEHCQLNASEAIKGGAVELSDVQFLTAFAVADGQCRALHIEVNGNTSHASLSAYSETGDMPHALANAKYLVGEQAQILSLDILRERCSKAMPTQGDFLDQCFMNFGPRWGCVKGVFAGDQEALLDIRLPPEFEADLDGFAWHPAMMDMAIGGAQFLIDGFSKEKDFYVPIGYEKAIIYQSCPMQLYSHVRVVPSSVSGLISFDIDMLDASGLCFTKVIGFTMKKVSGDFKSSLDEMASTINQHRGNSLDSILQDAMLPAEGAEAFDRVMSQQQQAQWIVSSVDTALWLQQLDMSEPTTEDRIIYVKEDTHDPESDPDIPSIEQTLAANRALQRLAVRSHLDENGDRRLVAHYEVDWDSSITVSELRSYAREVLEPEMVPQYFVEHDELPLTDDGEVYRGDLKDPLVQEDTHIAPKTATEKALATIWQDVLGVSKVSLNDNFFDIGGHSLLSIRVILRAEKKLGVRLDQAVMALQTLEQLAKDIDMRSVAVSNDSDVRSKVNTQGIPEKQKSGGLLKSWLGKKS